MAVPESLQDGGVSVRASRDALWEERLVGEGGGERKHKDNMTATREMTRQAVSC